MSNTKDPTPEEDSGSESSDDEMVLKVGGFADESDDDDEDDQEAPQPKKKQKVEEEEYEFTLVEMSPDLKDSVSALMFGGWAGGFARDVTEAVVDQVSVGTCASQDEDVFVVSTLLNTQDEECKFMPALIKSFGGAAAPFIKEGKTGIFISERMVNVPILLVSGVLSAIVEDVKWARENAEGDGGKERELYKFDRIIVAGKVEEPGQVSGSKGDWVVPEMTRIEEEVMMRKSHFKPGSFKRGGKEYLVGGISWKEFVECADEIKALIV